NNSVEILLFPASKRDDFANMHPMAVARSGGSGDGPLRGGVVEG
ncbi:hypothetical protein L195_g062948, partial [Trifolium pratense]